MKRRLLLLLATVMVPGGVSEAQELCPWLDEISLFLNENHLRGKNSVTVAVIDGGFDVSVPEINERLWTNAGEVAGDGLDNDGNGYPDDIHGWNFLGNAEGKDVISAGTAEYREYKRLRPAYKNADTTSFDENQLAGYRHYLEMESAAKIPGLYKYRDMLLAQMAALEEEPDTTGLSMYLDYMKSRQEEIEHNIAQLDIDDDVHRGMGNDPDDFSDLKYGNNHIHVDDYHGTMVAGLIAMTARKCNAEVSLMLIRAVPGKGDEFDRDIAASVRYAVDNGADIINMSLGKRFSPHVREVSEAIDYAAENNVLVVMSAGNSGQDNDMITSYPSPFRPDGRRHRNMIVIGSHGSDGLPASFSNFGKRTVDIFAPGVDIMSTAPGGGCDSSNGTSLSAPIVSGIAAVMKSFNPEMTATALAETIKGTADGGNLNPAEAVRSAIGPFVDWEQVEKFSSSRLHALAKDTYVSVKWDKVRNREIASWDRWYFIPKVMKRPARMYDDSSLLTLLSSVDSAKTAAVKDGVLRIRPDFESEDVICFEWGEKNVRYSISKKRILSAEPVERQRRISYGNDYWKKWSADSAYFVYALDHDLYLGRRGDGEGLRLTDDGELYHSFSSTGKRPGGKAGQPEYAVGSWIPGTHSYFVLREDTRKVGFMSVINSLSEPRPEVRTYKYAMSGDKDVAQYDCWLVDADSSSVLKVQTDRWKDQKIVVPRFRGVNTTSHAAWVLRVNRALDSLELCRISAPDGELKVVIREECKPHYNETLFDYHIINDGKEILWWSEREGKGAWYLYSGDGELKNKIAGGDFVAGQIHKIDTTGRNIIFCGYGYYKDVNPEFDFYFKAGLDGKKSVCLTPEDGNHTIELSKNGKYLTDTYSRIDSAPQTHIYDLAGNDLALVSLADFTDVYACGWKEPELVRVKAADGVTDLWGVVYLPEKIEPGRKYPVISHVYPGPQTDLLPKSFVFDDDGNHSMAQMGCVVINFMHRGCNPWMGREFSNYAYGNLRDYPLEDDKAIIEQLAEKYPFIDLDRVGIFGHSGGGFMAATALMTYPDFYKVAVAASGNFDNNIYSILWGEVYHGQGAIPTTQELAGRLRGKLLLITGDVDDNVNPASTYRLANALIKEGKPFDMLVIPGATHDIGSDYFENVVRYYFLNNLLGIKTYDKDIVRHE